jgi:hypothetical protein
VGLAGWNGRFGNHGSSCANNIIGENSMKISLEEAMKRADGPFFICQDTVERPKADAPVLIHCFTNFPEAVALLKQIMENAGDFRGRDGEYVNNGLREAVKRFEEVEVP